MKVVTTIVKNVKIVLSSFMNHCLINYVNHIDKKLCLYL